MPAPRREGSLVRKFGLSTILLVLFLGSWGGQAIAQWQEFTNEQSTHGQPATVSEFMPQFWQATFENWQSEFLQLFSFIGLSAVLIHRGSAESRDSEDEISEALERIERRLGDLER